LADDWPGMKVLHVIPSLDPATGGPAAVAIAIAAAEAALGCDVQLISYEFPHAAQGIHAMLKSIPEADKVQLKYLPPLNRREYLFTAEARRQMRPLVTEVDLVHLHGVWDPIILAASKLAIEAGRRYVLTVHGMFNPWAISYKPWKKRLALAIGYRGMLNRAAMLHYLNSDERDYAARMGFRAPTRVMPNGIFLEALEPRPPRGAFRAAHAELGEGPMIMYLGRLHPSKGLEILANAFAQTARQFPDARLLVAGPDAGAGDNFKALIQQLGIADRVLLAGALYGPAKLQALVDSDCFCLPSRTEGFSMAIIEAMACGLPVVITENCHFPLVASAQGGIVTDLNPDNIARALLTILGNRAQAQRMGEAGAALVKARFTWPKIAREMLEAYDQVLNA
jgi:glycosyltransferase involved in cell wall biosynthesis